MNSNVEAGHTGSADSKPLSCTSCRSRKVKCDRVAPCGPCTKSGIQCVFPKRVRVPRGRQGGKARDNELLKRISRLETLLTEKVDVSQNASMEAESTPETDPSERSRSSISAAEPDFLEKDGLEYEENRLPGGLAACYAQFVKSQNTGSNRYASGGFWTSLGDEVEGLKQLLQQSAEDSDDNEEALSHPSESNNNSPSYLFKDPGSPEDFKVAHPSDTHRAVLFSAYFENFHPVCKILHQPSITAHLLGSTQLMDQRHRKFKFTSLEAISFAIYFGAVTSMTDDECVREFDEDRESLVKRYRRSVEVALSQADFLNSMEIVTLNAFVIYLMALRSTDKSRSSWTLMALAIRVAHGMNLHRDGDGSAYNTFEAEQRRRTWWMILVLDMRAAEDRGTEPAITDGSFNIRRPTNINDSDYGYSSTGQLVDRQGLTDMSMCLMMMEISNAIRKINFIPATDDKQVPSPSQREDVVKQCAAKIEMHMNMPESSSSWAWNIKMLGRLLILRLWSVLQYPLQSRADTRMRLPKGQSLRTVVAYLELGAFISMHPHAQKFTWLHRTYVPWHPMAIALAELCTETQGPLADQAWAVIDRGYHYWAETVADERDGMLWRPIKKLYQKAKAARLRDETSSKAINPAPSMDLATQAQSLKIDNSHIKSGMPQTGLGLETPFGLLPNGIAPFDIGPEDTNMMTQTLDWDPPMMPTIGSSDLFGNEPFGEALGGQINWDDWNEFIFDAGELGVDVSNQNQMFNTWPMQA